MYTEKIIDRFKHPRFAGKMKDPSSTGEVGNASCGDIMKVFIKVNKNEIGEEIIEDISYLTYGCVAAIVSTDYLCEIVKGKTLDKARNITKDEIISKLESLPPGKIHCSVLASEALKKAIENYRNKSKA